MADSKELQTQLQINQQINKVLADRAKQMDALSKQIGGQAQLAKELCKAMECQDLDGLEDRIAGLSSTLSSAAEEASKAGGALDKMGQDGQKSTGGLGDTLGNILSKFTPMKAAAVGAASGMMKTFSRLPGMFSMISGGIGSVVGGLFNVGKSIVGIPFQVLGEFTKAAASTTGGVNELRQAMEELKGEMGDLSKGEGAAVMEGFDNLRSSSSALAQSGLSVSQVFGYGSGGAAAMLKAVGEIAKAAGPQFSMLKDQIAGAADKMVMMNKGLGMTNEALAEMARKAHNTGKDVGTELVEMGSMAIQMGNKFGVSAKTIGKNMSALTEDVANFGNMSKKELAATATYMAKLGMEAKDLQGVIDKFDDFESAAGSVAQLNQAFGLQLDTMEMMNAQNPAERIDKMREAFHAAGKSVDDMSRAEKKLMAEQMGLSVSAMENALATENMGVAYEDMEAAAEESEANKMSEKEVMLELSKSIQKLVHSGQGVDGFFDAFAKGFSRGFAQNKEYKESIMEIKKAFKVVMDFGKKLGGMFADLMGKLGLFDAVKKIFNAEALKGLFDKLTGYFQKFSDSISGGGDYSIVDLIKDVFGDVYDYITGGAGAEGASAFSKFFENIIRVIGDALADLIPFLATKLGDLMNSVASFLSDPGGLDGASDGLSTGIGGAFADAFAKIGPALQDAWPPIWEGLQNMFWAVMDRFGPLIFKVMAGIVAFNVAKAVVAGLIEAAGAAIVAKIVGFFTGDLGGKVGAGLEKEGGDAMKKEGGGFFEGLKSMIEKIGEISPKDVVKAGFNLTILAAFAGISLVLFAGAIALAYAILKDVPFTGLLKVFLALAIAIAAMVPFVFAALMMEPTTITTAGLMMLVGALFFTVSVVAFAAGIRIAYEVLKAIPFVDFVKILGMLALTLMATIALGAVGMLFGSFVTAVPIMIVGMVAAALLFTAGVLIFGKALQELLPTFKKISDSLPIIGPAIGAIIVMVGIIAGMAGLGVAFAAIGIFAPILAGGFKVAADFFVGAMGDIKRMISALMSLEIPNVDDVAKRINVIAKVAEVMQSLAGIGLDAAKLGVVSQLMGGPSMSEIFTSIGDLLGKITDSLVTIMVTLVFLAGVLPDGSEKKVEVIAGALGAVAELASALMTPLQALSEISSGMFGKDVAKTMGAIVDGIIKLLDAIKDTLPDMLLTLIVMANLVGDPEKAGPRMKVVVDAMAAVGNFAKAIGDVSKLIPKDDSWFGGDDLATRIGQMAKMITTIVNSVKNEMPKLINAVLDAAAGLGDDAAVELALKKVDVVSKAMAAVGSFADTVSKLSGMQVPEGSSVGGLVKNVVQGMVSSLTGENSIATLFTTLESMTLNEAALTTLDTAGKMTKGLIDFSQALTELTTASEGMGPAETMGAAVTAMVDNAKAAITALNSVGELNAKVALDNFAKAIGTGDGQFNVTNEPVNITLNVQVTMDADKVGKVLVDKSVMTTALASAEG